MIGSVAEGKKVIKNRSQDFCWKSGSVVISFAKIDKTWKWRTATRKVEVRSDQGCFLAYFNSETFITHPDEEASPWGTHYRTINIQRIFKGITLGKDKYRENGNREEKPGRALKKQQHYMACRVEETKESGNR